MRILYALTAVAVGLVAVSAPAQAAPPDNDNYLEATQINDPGTGLLGTGATRETYRDFPITSEATTQADIFDPPGSGGGEEELRCPVAADQYAAYGKTIWYDVHPDVNGALFIQASGFDSVLGSVRYESLDDPSVIPPWRCQDDPESPTLEEAGLTVLAGNHYSIQVGGFADYVDNPADPDPGTPASGTLDFRVQFFPDRDLDGVFDSNDRCPTDKGPASLRGCPDRDGDGIPDVDDDCDTVPGPRSLGGCRDGDGDGVRDVSDRCPAEDARARDANTNGCLDYGILGSKSPYRFDSVYRRSRLIGVKFSRIKVSALPGGTEAKLSCKPKGRCKTSTVRLSASKSFLRSKLVRVGTTISLKLTKSGYVGRLIRFKVTSRRRGKFKVGRVSKSVRCIPATGGRARSCKLLSTVR